MGEAFNDAYAKLLRDLKPLTSPVIPPLSFFSKKRNLPCSYLSAVIVFGDALNHSICLSLSLLNKDSDFSCSNLPK